MPRAKSQNACRRQSPLGSMSPGGTRKVPLRKVTGHQGPGAVLHMDRLFPWQLTGHESVWEWEMLQISNNLFYAIGSRLHLSLGAEINPRHACVSVLSFRCLQHKRAGVLLPAIYWWLLLIRPGTRWRQRQLPQTFRRRHRLDCIG